MSIYKKPKMAGFQSSVGEKLQSVALRYHRRGRVSGWYYGHVNHNPLFVNTYVAEHTPTKGGANFRDEHLAELEAVLFLAPHPVASRKLAEMTDLADGTKARTLVRTLNRMYDAQGCAFRVEEVAGGFQLMTRAKFAPWLRRLHSAGVEVRLSAPAMETLAVVAYRQPILRAEIEAIRGVQSGEVLRQLIERDLVRIAGRSAELGRPFLYGTSKRFLQIFGLKHIEELPQPEFLQNIQTTAGASLSRIGSSENNTKEPKYSLEAEEETNVKTLTTTKTRLEELTEEGMTVLADPQRSKQPDLQFPRGQLDDEDDDVEDEDEDKDEDEDEEYDDEYDEDEDFDDLDDDEEDDDEEEDEEEDEDLEEDEPWEEVEDEDEEEEEVEDEDDEDWEDEDWDDEDWEDEDEDWEEDEDEDEEEDEEDEK